MSDMYQEAILDYYRRPRNKRALPGADIVEKDANVSCGDVITMYVRVKNGVAEEVTFAGEGCAISQAAASMLTEHAQGKKLTEIAKINKGDIVGLLNIPVSPVRLKCALLGLKVLKLGVVKWEVQNGS